MTHKPNGNVCQLKHGWPNAGGSVKLDLDFDPHVHMKEAKLALAN